MFLRGGYTQKIVLIFFLYALSFFFHYIHTFKKKNAVFTLILQRLCMFNFVSK